MQAKRKIKQTEDDYMPVIKACEGKLNRAFGTKRWNDDEYIIQLYDVYLTALTNQIHQVLLPQKTAESEALVRDIIKKQVIGYVDSATKINFLGGVTPIRAKLAQIQQSNSVKSEILSRYLELYDGFMALASLRSFKHYCLYLQSVFGFTLFDDTPNCFNGYFYYANKMVLDGSVHFMEKQLPTGYGKCVSPDTLVRTTKGIMPISNVNVGDFVYSMYKNSLVAQKVTNKWYNRKKQVKITTKGGSEIIVSPEHRMYTQKGYVQAQNLTQQDFLYRLCAKMQNGTRQYQNEFEFATIMLFGGKLKDGKVILRRKNGALINRFFDLCNRLNIDSKCYYESKKNKAVILLDKDNKAKTIFKKYGISFDKPESNSLSPLFLNLPLEQKITFISLMLATAGDIPCPKRRQELCNVTFKSKTLALGVQKLLNSCRVYSVVTEIKNEQDFDSTYRLEIPDSFFRTISESCYFYDNQEAVDEKLSLGEKKKYQVKTYQEYTRYPKEVLQGCEEFKKYFEKVYDKTTAFPHRTVNKFYWRTGLLADVIYKDFVFEPIKDVEFIDEEIDMIDIEVENTHNFIANDLVSHNSITDAFMQSWIFGVDVDNDILKVCGNDKFVNDCFENVIKIMQNEKYSKVFPYYSQFNYNDSMFSYKSKEDCKFAIKGSKKSTNLRVVTKLSDVNGVRAKYLFLDDITQRRDMSNLAQHERDIHAFTHEWFERNYSRENFFVIASGTTYSQFDLLSHLKKIMGGENAVVSSVNKYTSVGVSDQIVPGGVSVFVSVPLLDYDTDESTYPKKISTFSARKKRETNPKEFWAMDMQRPLPPENSPFYFVNLRSYKTLPQIGEHGRTDCCIAALDPKRRGKDFLSMPIFFEADDFEHKDTTAFYLKDWLYDQRTMTECIPLIVAKIIKNNVVRLLVERNTEECIATLLKDKLKERGYTNIIIDEIFSLEPKDRRIMEAEGDIKSKIIFPEFGMYSIGSEIGNALQNLYGYSYVARNEHDDAPDSVALFSKHFIHNKGLEFAKPLTFRR